MCPSISSSIYQGLTCAGFLCVCLLQGWGLWRIENFPFSMLTLTQHTAPDSNYPKHRGYREVNANNQVGPSRLPKVRGGQSCWFPHHRAESLAQHHLRSLKVGVLLGRPLPPTNKRGAPAFSESLCGQADQSAQPWADSLNIHPQSSRQTSHRGASSPAQPGSRDLVLLLHLPGFVPGGLSTQRLGHLSTHWQEAPGGEGQARVPSGQSKLHAPPQPSVTEPTTCPG